MVAYSFKSRFGGPVVTRTKRQTIRRPRKRHARPGELVQLYTGMRTRSCRLLLETVCRAVEPVEIEVLATGIASVLVGGIPIGDLEAFARADGFRDLSDMSAFWLAEHGIGVFEGVIVGWE